MASNRRGMERSARLRTTSQARSATRPRSAEMTPKPVTSVPGSTPRMTIGGHHGGVMEQWSNGVMEYWSNGVGTADFGKPGSELQRNVASWHFSNSPNHGRPPNLHYSNYCSLKLLSA